MKFVGLLSGGKDSCFNIIKCIENGHELVALANLMPPEEEIEEMNSFMYQSAAHNTIPLMAECFGVPLFRQEIIGKAAVQSLDYEKDDSDEVEDLFLLLQRVQLANPDLKGVSCGAIVSNYQRLRVEDVCSRLNLTPLTYLWMRDREELLDEIINCGVHAVLVKVAGAGLDPYKHLGKSLAVLRPTLQRLHERFGLDYCGEGGEYETLVLDCSAFKKRIVLDDTVVLLDEEDCSVGNLKVLKCSLVDKIVDKIADKVTVTEEEKGETVRTAAVIPLCNDLITSISNIVKQTLLPSKQSSQSDRSNFKVSIRTHKKVESADANSNNNNGNNSSNSNNGSSSNSSSSSRKNASFNCVYGKDGIGQTSRKTSVSHALAVKKGEDRNEGKQEEGEGAEIEGTEDKESLAVSQMRAIILQLLSDIEFHPLCDLKDACFIHLYLSNLSLFQAVNGEYCRWFGRNPPSRSCVAVPLPPGILVAADAVFLRGSFRTIQLGRSSRRQVLHVRSISSWAPLCIGPYAQANVLTDCLVYVAGQIPLDPSSMNIMGVMGVLGGNTHSSSSTVSTVPSSTSSTSSSSSPYPPPSSSSSSSSSLPPLPPSSPSSSSPPPSTSSILMHLITTQLALSLRHAARVLGPLNSSLTRSLACTVYLNMEVLERDYSAGLEREREKNGNNGSKESNNGINNVGNNENNDDKRENGNKGDNNNNINNTNNTPHNNKYDWSNWSGWDEITLITQRLLANNCMEPIPGMLIIKKKNADGDSDSDSDDNEGDENDNDENDSDEENQSDNRRKERGKDSKKGATVKKGQKGNEEAPLPVLVIGVRGIPRDCLVEAEVLSFTELLPGGCFRNDGADYYLTLPSTSPTSPSSSSSLSLLNTPSLLKSNLEGISHLSIKEDIKEEMKDSTTIVYPIPEHMGNLLHLNPDLWPLWHRDDETIGTGKIDRKNESHGQCEANEIESNNDSNNKSSNPNNNDNDNNDSGDNDNDDNTVEYIIDRMSADAVGDNSSDIEDRNVPGGRGVSIVSTVRSTQCTYCVCSGFSDVSFQSGECSLTANSKERSLDNNSSKELSGALECSLELIQHASDTLFLSIFRQMGEAGFDVSDVHTLRLYYQPNILRNIVEDYVNECKRKRREEGKEEGVEEVEGDRLELMLHTVCGTSIMRVFKVDMSAFPLLLIPVTRLASRHNNNDRGSDIKYSEIHLFSSHFLFIDLRQIKSETWINGH